MAEGRLNTTMYGMSDLQKITGYTSDQLRDRLGRVWGIVAQDHRRGPKNAVLVGDKTLAVLRRMRELESAEVGPNDAAKQIMAELGVDGDGARKGPSSVAHGAPKQPQTSPNASQNTSDESALVDELRDRIRFLERENERLWGLVDGLRALPAPRAEEDRRPWIVRRLRSLVSRR